jgi:hypothetical protein
MGRGRSNAPVKIDKNTSKKQGWLPETQTRAEALGSPMGNFPHYAKSGTPARRFLFVDLSL